MAHHEKKRIAVFAFAMLAGLASFLMGKLLTGHNLYAGIIGGCVSFVATVIGERMERSHRASLSERAKRPAVLPPEDETTWDVRMNGVQAGRITDRELAAIQGQVANDWRIWLAQLVNLLGVPFTVLEKQLALVPAIAFWLILGFSVLDPSGLTQTITALRNASAHEVQQSVTNASWMLLMTGLIVYGLYGLVYGYTFGLRNVANEELSYRLRRRLKIAAMGDLSISRISDGEPSLYSPSLLGWLRSRAEARRAERERGAAVTPQ